ncbi:MAG: ATP synthase subunit I [Acidimicrobiales bacterium]
MFEQSKLPDVAAVARRTTLGALVVGVVGLVALLFFDQPWAALGLCIGLGMGMANFRLIVRSVVKVGKRAQANKRRPLAMNTLSRLMLMTVIALVLVWFVTPLGFGIIGGLALFQFILLANVTRSMLKAGGAGGASLLGVLTSRGLGLDEDAGAPVAIEPPAAHGEGEGQGAA